MATLSILGLYDMTPDLFKGFTVPAGLDRDAAIFDICTECAELEILYPDGDFMTQAIAMWCKMRAESWNRLYKALVTSEYSPIENTDRQTEISDTRQTDGTESGSSESNSAECAITVGYKANTFRTCTNSAKSAKKSDCRSISTVCLAIFTRNTNFKHVCASLRTY